MKRAAVLFILLVACGGMSKEAALSRANAGLSTALVATNAMRDSLVTWDADLQAAIVAKATSEDAGKAALVAYRAKRAVLVEAFAVAYASIGLASSSLALYDAGQMSAPAVIKQLRASAAAVLAVKTAVDALRGSP